MSYNIDTCIVKKLDNFSFPKDEIEKHLPNRTWQPVYKQEDTDYIIEFSELSYLKGTLVDYGARFLVNSLELYGEGSGTTFSILLETFKKSTGNLHLKLVWEGGDSLSELIVNDGDIQDIPIEL